MALKMNLLFFLLLSGGPFAAVSDAVQTAGKNDFPVLTEPYLGQKPPGMAPEIIASEFPFPLVGGVFSPDGKELFFLFRSGVMETRLENGRWLEPQLAPFSGKYRHSDLNFSPDGRKLFFASTRPLEKDGPPLSHYDLWVVQRTETGWSEPESLGPLINSEHFESFPSVAENGDLFFFREIRTGRSRTADIYRSKYRDGRYAAPEKLGTEINSDDLDLDPFVAPDESYLIFLSFRPGGFGRADLYISFRKNDGSWAPAVNMGEKINTAGDEFCGRVTPDGKYFFFDRSAQQPRPFNKYWVSAKIIEDLKKTAMR